MSDDLDLRDAGAVQREDPLHAFVRDDAADGDGPVDAPALVADEDALEDLDAFLLAFDDQVVDVERVADREAGEGVVGLELAGDRRFDGFRASG